MDMYSLDTTRVADITYSQYKNENKIKNFYWTPNSKIVDKLCELLEKREIKHRIIDIGCGIGPAKFPSATHILDFENVDEKNEFSIKLDLDFDKFSHPDKYFEFIYCRHTLEDIQNPQNAFNEFIRISKVGYIETPSPLVEIMKGVDAPFPGMSHSGYRHHRYIVWSDIEKNTLFFLPKYPIVEHIHMDETLLKKYQYLLNNYSVYWNNYYFWDIIGKPPKIVVYRNDINFKISEDYERLINEAIQSSFRYTNQFIKFISEIK